MPRIPPFVVEIVGLPHSGKTVVINALIGRFKGSRVWVVSQDLPTDPCSIFVSELLKGTKRKTRSLIFRALVRIADDRIKDSTQELIFVEHGPNFTWAMERRWAGNSVKCLAPDFTVKEPHLVVFLDTPPDVVRERGATQVLRNAKKLAVIYKEMRRMALDKGWSQIAGRSRPLTIDETVEVAYRTVKARYEEYRKCPVRMRPFTH